jgi:uncharacterized protein (TIGR02145 family)
MKRHILLIFMLIGTFFCLSGQNTNPASTGIFTDSRDGHVYKWVKIGSQTWMAENLAYLPFVDSSSQASDTLPCYYVYGYEGNNVDEAKEYSNYHNYGVLYNWQAAMNGASSSTSVPSGVQGICPPNWHLPSDAEWTILPEYLTNNGYGYGDSAGAIGKSLASTSGWTSSAVSGEIGNDQASNNRSGFNAPAGGFRSYRGGGGFQGIDAVFWSSSEDGSTGIWRRLLNCHDDN